MLPGTGPRPPVLASSGADSAASRFRIGSKAEEEIDSEFGKSEGSSGGFSATTGKLEAFERKLADIEGEARGEWEADIDKLAALCDRLQKRVKAIRRQTGHAAEKLKPQAEKLSDEISAVVERLKRRRAARSS